ncbi:unnamed protein product [Vicia faba]|uniref:Uncharacterized protein n=1 Tax=Vicia faba TaxID=3906 RepID=A0AAV0ZTN7_VICFA|nr:unnamed protein product [Vicia faba]
MGSRPRLYGDVDLHAFLYILIQRSHEEDKKVSSDLTGRRRRDTVLQSPSSKKKFRNQFRLAKIIKESLLMEVAEILVQICRCVAVGVSVSMKGYQLVQGLIWIWCQFLRMQGCLNWLRRLREHSAMASMKANGSDEKES